MSKSERIRHIKNLIGIFKRERNYNKVDRLKFLLKQAKKI